jgi:mRNA interferase RelE/StbE
MKYRVKLSPASTDAFTNIHPEIRKFLKEGMKYLAENHFAGKTLEDEFIGFRSYKIKRYRIVYKVDDKEKVIRIYMLGHRKIIYEVLKAMIKKSL